jgi:hypothetical protein
MPFRTEGVAGAGAAAAGGNRRKKYLLHLIDNYCYPES